MENSNDKLIFAFQWMGTSEQYKSLLQMGIILEGVSQEDGSCIATTGDKVNLTDWITSSNVWKDKDFRDKFDQVTVYREKINAQ